jgi:hypothetical protein
VLVTLCRDVTLSGVDRIFERCLILSSPGVFVGVIECRHCFRVVHVDPYFFPPAPVPESYGARLRAGDVADGARICLALLKTATRSAVKLNR